MKTKSTRKMLETEQVFFYILYPLSFSRSLTSYICFRFVCG